jgi:hypothetical protein
MLIIAFTTPNPITKTKPKLGNFGAVVVEKGEGYSKFGETWRITNKLVDYSASYILIYS